MKPRICPLGSTRKIASIRQTAFLHHLHQSDGWDSGHQAIRAKLKGKLLYGFILLSVLMLPSSGAHAQERTATTYVDGGGTYWIKIPASVEKVRGILFHTGIGTGTLYDRPQKIETYALAETMDCALLYSQGLGSRTMINPTRDPINRALADLALQLDMPELAWAPMMTFGMSIGGNAAFNVAFNQEYEKMIALSTDKEDLDYLKYAEEPYRENYSTYPASIPVFGVPSLVIGGKTDPRHRPQVFDTWRENEQPLAVTIEEVGHSLIDGFHLQLPYFWEVFKVRYPRAKYAEDGPVTLNPLSQESGWLVNMDDAEQRFFALPEPYDPANDNTSTSWLPTKRAAFIFAAFASWKKISMSADAPRFLQPWQLSNGIKYTAAFAKSTDWQELKFYEGDIEIFSISKMEALSSAAIQKDKGTFRYIRSDPDVNKFSFSYYADESRPYTHYAIVTLANGQKRYTHPRTTVVVNPSKKVMYDLPLVTYDEWAQSAGLSGDDALPTAVPFRDGVENIVKYAFNMDGGRVDHSRLVSGVGTSGLPVLGLGGAGSEQNIHFEFLRRAGKSVSYMPLQSSDLSEGSWIPAAGNTSVSDIDMEWQRVSIDVPVAGDRTRLFYKIDISEGGSTPFNPLSQNFVGNAGVHKNVAAYGWRGYDENGTDYSSSTVDPFKAAFFNSDDGYLFVGSLIANSKSYAAISDFGPFDTTANPELNLSFAHSDTDDGTQDSGTMGYRVVADVDGVIYSSDFISRNVSGSFVEASVSTADAVWHVWTGENDLTDGFNLAGIATGGGHALSGMISDIGLVITDGPDGNDRLRVDRFTVSGAESLINVYSTDFSSGGTTSGDLMRAAWTNSWRSGSGTAWAISGGVLRNNNTTANAIGTEASIVRYFGSNSADLAGATKLAIKFDYTVASGDTLYFHFWGTSDDVGNTRMLDLSTSINGGLVLDSSYGGMRHNLSNGSVIYKAADTSASAAFASLTGSGTFEREIDIPALGIDGVRTAADFVNYLITFSKEVGGVGSGVLSIDNFELNAVQISDVQ
ncbi:hypothetical protein [Haloferula sp.]|uniref:hypothetical protein n=1 Tax=Haloferula sp. TaxID=2497595 RepID=UPI003C77F7C7